MKKITELEYDLTAELLDLLEIDIAGDLSLSHDGKDLILNNHNMGFSEFYESIWTVKPHVLFTPLSSEKHSDLLIRVFGYMRSDLDIEIYEIVKNDDNTVNGYFVDSNKEVLKKSRVYKFDTVSQARCASIAKLLYKDDKDKYKEFVGNILKINAENKKRQKLRKEKSENK